MTEKQENSFFSAPGIDALIFIFLALLSLETTVPFALDQLDDNKSIESLAFLKPFIAPGDTNPLVIMNRHFTPIKLLIRSITVLIIGLYLGLEISAMRRKRILQRLLLISVIGLHTLIPLLLMIMARISGPNPWLAHDGGTLQIEAASNFFLQGVNPYSTDYTETELNNWRGFKNNIVYHLPYMPGSFLFSTPFQVLWKAFFGWYDQRIFHLILFIASIWLLNALIRDDKSKIIGISFFALNPLIAKYFILGANDILTFFAIITYVYFAFKKRYTAAFVFLAIACSIKQFAWFFVPFAVLHHYFAESSSRRTSAEKIWKVCARILAPGAILFLLICLPFAAWDFKAFYEDTISYGAGGLPTSYPMQGFHGYGFASVVLFFRMVESGSADFPFSVIQLSTTLPVLLILLVHFRKKPDLNGVVFLSSLVLLVFMYFSRYLHGNFVGFIMFWPVLAYCMTDVSAGSESQCAEFAE